jgi:hypothetical protein
LSLEKCCGSLALLQQLGPTPAKKGVKPSTQHGLGDLVLSRRPVEQETRQHQPKLPCPQPCVTVGAGWLDQDLVQGKPHGTPKRGAKESWRRAEGKAGLAEERFHVKGGKDIERIP